jgi:hypothetical protein
LTSTINLFQRLVSLGRAGSLIHAAADRQAKTVLHYGMPHIAKPGWLPVAVLVEPRLGIGRALVRLVGALLLMEVALRVAAGTLAVIVTSILGSS